MPEKWKMWNFEDNLFAKGIIIRYTSKPERFFFYFIILWLIFYISSMLGEKEKQRTWGKRACEWCKQAHWLVDFFPWNCDWTRAWSWQAVMSNELSQRLIDQNRKAALLVYVLPIALFENYSKKPFLMDK